MPSIRVSFGAKNFQSNQKVFFTVYNKRGNLIYKKFGNEWGNTGVYYLDIKLKFSFFRNNIYLVIAEEINGNWKAFKTIKRIDRL